MAGCHNRPVSAYRQVLGIIVIAAACGAGPAANDENEASSTADADGTTSDSSSSEAGSSDSGSSDSSSSDSSSSDSSSSDSSSSDSETDGCEDECPMPSGIEWGCEQRFMYGVNYAWHHFGGDFGGISTWGQGGVAAESQAHSDKLADMADHGVSTIRWWMFPEFRGESISFDADEVPLGLGATTSADIEAALALAQEHDVYLMLTLFSFDNFRPSRDEAGIWVPGMQPIVTDARKRQALLDNVVRPVAQTVAASPYAHRMIAWDVINEPEWAITGPGLYGGDEDFDPNAELQAVSHMQMETFIGEAIAVLREESDALISVGGAAMKWKSAWTQSDVDFYQLHIYDWVNDYWPYTMSPADYGIDDKPVVMGEYPLGGLSAADFSTMTSSWYDNGYAGALAWQYDEATAQQLDEVAAFAETHPCQTRF